MSKQVNDEKYGVVRLHQYTILKYGKARSGKTLTGVAESVFSSQVLWSQLVNKYEITKKRALLFENYNNEIFMLRWQEIERSYDFWCSHSDCIPCLFSNIKIYYNGLKSMDLAIEHFRQEKWLPSYTILFMDEIGRWLGVDKSNPNQKIPRINDFICWIGQFCECHLIATEQRPTNAMKDLRGVIGVNERILSMDKTHQAYALLSVLQRFEQIAIRKCWSAETFEILAKIRKWTERVGFLVFKIEAIGNIDLPSVADVDNRTVYLLANTQFKYDSRAFQKVWLASDFADTNTASNSLLVDIHGELAQSLYQKYIEADEKETNKKTV